MQKSTKQYLLSYPRFADCLWLMNEVKIKEIFFMTGTTKDHQFIFSLRWGDWSLIELFILVSLGCEKVTSETWAGTETHGPGIQSNGRVFQCEVRITSRAQEQPGSTSPLRQYTQVYVSWHLVFSDTIKVVLIGLSDKLLIRPFHLWNLCFGNYVRLIMHHRLNLIWVNRNGWKLGVKYVYLVHSRVHIFGKWLSFNI